MIKGKGVMTALHLSYPCCFAIGSNSETILKWYHSVDLLKAFDEIAGAGKAGGIGKIAYRKIALFRH